MGFRYTAKKIISVWPRLTGHVKNLPDGTVELLLQGRKEEIQAALQTIRVRWGSSIQNAEERWDTPTRTLEGFGIDG